MKHEEIPNCFYRISVKALVLNETRDKFLIVQEENGLWEFPGGGLDWGMTPQEDLPREIDEEMGLKVTWIADDPSYFFTMPRNDVNMSHMIANILYEATFDSLGFTPSDECVATKFVNKEDIEKLETYPNLPILAEMFDPKKH